MWLTLIGLGLKLLGFADLAQRMFEKADARKRGMDEQKAADDRATVDAAVRGARIGSEVAGRATIRLWRI